MMVQLRLWFVSLLLLSLTACSTAPPLLLPGPVDLDAIVVDQRVVTSAATSLAAGVDVPGYRLMARNELSIAQLQGDGHFVILFKLNTACVATSPNPRDCAPDITGTWLPVWATGVRFPRPDCPDPNDPRCTPEPPPPPPLGGDVFLQDHAFADDHGPFLALGSSYFSALHRERTDRPGLQGELTWLADRGVRYVRILSMVGNLPFWAGRIIDPTRPGYFATFDDLIVDASAVGIRLQVVLFADAQTMMPRQVDRLIWVNTMASYLELHRPVVQFVEIANESQINGVNDADLAELTRRWASLSTIPVAPSSTTGEHDPELALETLFNEQTLTVDLLTPHFQRNDWEENYRHWRQPWEVHDYSAPNTTAFTNNEPQRDTVASRVAVGFANTIISAGAGFVWHTDAGVRGWRDFSAMPNAEAVLAALDFVQDFLPATLPNGEYCNHHWTCHPYEDLDQIWTDNSTGLGVVRAYSSQTGGITYVALTGMKGRYAMAAKQPMRIEVFSLCTQRQAGAAITLTTDQAHTFRPVAGCRDYLHRVTSP